MWENQGILTYFNTLPHFSRLSTPPTTPTTPGARWRRYAFATPQSCKVSRRSAARWKRSTAALRSSRGGPFASAGDGIVAMSRYYIYIPFIYSIILGYNKPIIPIIGYYIPIIRYYIPIYTILSIFIPFWSNLMGIWWLNFVILWYMISGDDLMII